MHALHNAEGICHPEDSYLSIPGTERLDGATEHDDLPSGGRVDDEAVVKARGSRPSVLDVRQAHIEGDCLGKEGHEGSLLQLVLQDVCIALAPAEHIRCSIDAHSQYLSHTRTQPLRLPCDWDFQWTVLHQRSCPCRAHQNLIQCPFMVSCN